MSLLLQAAPEAIEVSQSTDGFGPYSFYATFIIITLIVVMLALFVCAVLANRALKTLVRMKRPDLVGEEQSRKVQFSRIWNKIMGLRPISEEKDIVIDHEYDGIKELDNPIPMWFNVLFYGTILFGIVYLFVYQFSDIGMNQDQEYAHEMEVAEKERQLYLATSSSNVDENSVEFKPEMAADGQAIYNVNCVACHGNNGEGSIGPNLTDKYWLHGGEIKDVFRTIKYGVPDKGMVPWEQTLSPSQIAQVASYIVTLRDSNPANAKEPQGEPVIYGDGSENENSTAEQAINDKNTEL